ncbi:MAG: sulfurtransferase [Rhodospirillaceae bacterium]|nr:sulfurtransferase [Rhodospirillaceae bacterium]|tara:strand:- start:32101 stop:32952 length:852 start_codon:yes stop_codon:yes gene_type:complete
MQSLKINTEKLITSKWLYDHLDDPSIRIIEVGSGSNKTYQKSHIPGAIWWFWKDHCWHDTDRQFVTPEKLAQDLGKVGISPDNTLVLYGDPVQYGNYAFWVFTMAGHADIRLLDGSRTKWESEGLEMTTKTLEFAPVSYSPQTPNETMRIGRKNILDNLKNPNRLLLDMRSPEEYSGERVIEYGFFDHGAERGGRIPGAKHLHYKDLLNDDDSYKSADELQTLFNAIGVIKNSKIEIVCYCRLSHRASLAWFALTHILGYEGVKIYDGSWTEWGSIVGVPIEK